MSDEVESADGEEQQAETPPKKNRMMLFIIIGVAVVVLLGGGAAAYFMFFTGGGETESVEGVTPVYDYELPTMTVNLNSDKAEFLKLSVTLELPDESMVELIEPRMARVIDAFQVYLRELRRSDIEGSAGIYRLKEELRRRVNLAIYPAEVNGILFREILVQ